MKKIKFSLLGLALVGTVSVNSAFAEIQTSRAIKADRASATKSTIQQKKIFFKRKVAEAGQTTVAPTTTTSEMPAVQTNTTTTLPAVTSDTATTATTPEVVNPCPQGPQSVTNTGAKTDSTTTTTTTSTPAPASSSTLDTMQPQHKYEMDGLD